MEVRANAKINLCLDVVARREDGYHELNMVMVPLTLHDRLHIELAKEDRLTSNDKKMPCDERNTIIKALRLMKDIYNIEEHFAIHVYKHIPMEAGLAGGSADAAAIIHAVDILCGLHLHIEDKIRVGKQVGADVPFCLVNRPSFVSGIGEKVEQFDFSSSFHVLLVKPKQGVSTKAAYQTLDLNLCDHPNCETVKQALVQDDFDLLCKSIGNSLESSAFNLVPEVHALKAELQAYGFEAVLMSGSGSTVFALTRNETLLNKVHGELKNRYPFVEMTSILK